MNWCVWEWRCVLDGVGEPPGAAWRVAEEQGSAHLAGMPTPEHNTLVTVGHNLTHITGVESHAGLHICSSNRRRVQRPVSVRGPLPGTTTAPPQQPKSVLYCGARVRVWCGAVWAAYHREMLWSSVSSSARWLTVTMYIASGDMSMASTPFGCGCKQKGEAIGMDCVWSE